MTIIDEYLKYQLKYEEIYGSKTIVLFQNGSFFEIFGIDNDNEKIGYPQEISEILNIILTRKNKSIKENNIKNPLMCGFQKDSVDKYVKVLLNNDYTIIIVEQVSEPPYPKREVTQILSPTTYLESVSPESNYLACIYIEEEEINSKLYIGLSSIELTTGKCNVYETYSSSTDINKPLDEAFRFIKSYNPREIIMIKNVNKLSLITNDFLINFLELHNTIVHYRDSDSIPKSTYKISYQENFLSSIYHKKQTILNAIEYIDLEMYPIALTSFILLLKFAFEHNDTIIQKIEKPFIWKEPEQLIMDYNAINQLNIVSYNLNSANSRCKYDSLLSVLINTSTTLGTRLLKETLLEPITNYEKLQKKYDQISCLKENSSYKHIEKYLKQILDIERLHRKLNLSKLQPYEFASLITSYNVIFDLIEYIIKNFENTSLYELLPSVEYLNEFKIYREKLHAYFNIDELEGTNFSNSITNCIFNCKNENENENENDYDYESFKEIEKIKNEIDNCNKFLNDTQDRLINILNIPNSIKLEKNDKEGYFLSITSKRFELLKKIIKEKNILDINDCRGVGNKDDDEYNFEVKSTTTSKKIRTSKMIIVCEKLDILLENFNRIIRETYYKILEDFSNSYSQMFIKISNFVANLDVIKSNAKTATLNGYCKPEIIYKNKEEEEKEKENYSNSSKLYAKKLRHPLGEKLLVDEEYVPNDVKLDEKTRGLLVYGLNSSGKSNLMKAVGCNLIMAQAGMFVACEEFKYIPFDRIITRISGNDNIFKGQSSFAVEMSELRSILCRSTPKTLVLGDEICHGTEQTSGLAIVSASVIELSKKNVNFIFATHLHNLAYMDRIKKLENVKHCHFQVTYDKSVNKILYNRTLAEGNGSSIYGLEVASMSLNKEFIDLAKEIRREILNEDSNILTTKSSKYNANYFKKTYCEICKDKKAIDVHHIKYQCTADENGLIDGRFHKNEEYNLTSLCKECHQDVHKDLIKIEGYKMGSQGKELVYEKASNCLIV